MFSGSQWKVKSFHKREAIYWTRGQNLLTSIDTKTSSLFYGMIARTKIYVSTETFLAVFPLRLPFWPAQSIFYLLWFSKHKSSRSTAVSLENIAGNFSCETAWNKHHPFVCILLHCYFFVKRYYLLTENYQAWNF